MGERDDARHQVEQRRQRIAALAGEVSRRLTPEYAKGRAREMAREKVERVRESAVRSSWFAPAIGAGVGALVAKALRSRALEREGRYRGEGWRYRTYDEAGTLPSRVGEVPPTARGAEGTDESDGEWKEHAGARMEDVKDRARAKVDELKDRAGALTERAGAKAGELKDRMSAQVSSFRDRLPDRERIRESAHEDTALWALGAAALGMLFGFALPVSEKERRLLEPAKRKARELGEQAKEMAVQKGSEALDQASEKLEASGAGAEQEPQQEPQPTEPPPPIH